ncbi:hypothetical protein D3C79_876600 [compost metagenome]
MRPTFRPGYCWSGTLTWCSHPLTKPNQQLHRELKALGFDLEQTATEVIRITKDCRDIDVAAVLKLIAKLYEDADRVAALTDEVMAGRVTRTKE